MTVTRRRSSGSRGSAWRSSARRTWATSALVGLGLTALVTLGGNNWRVRAATNRFVGVGGSDTSNDCSNVGSPCATIQHAVGQSASGDTINVAAGTYFEHNITINGSVTIQGSLTGSTMVNGNNKDRVFFIQSGTVALNYLTITNGNGSGDCAGGIFIDTATVTVANSTISGNSGSCTSSPGGGISNNAGTVTVINSTISANSEDGASGASGAGGIASNGGSVTVINSTISGNSAGGGTGPGGINKNGGTFTVTNSIIATNSTGNCSGTISSGGHNLSSDGTCPFGGTGDMNNSNPKLGALQNNGGPTFTMALLAGSPAIDAGDDSVLGSPLFLTTDQRGAGFPRKSGSHVDIGAFELQQVVVGPSFDTCLKDNSTGNLFQWNSTTGQYKFTRCSDGFMLTGTGTVGLVNGIRTLTDFKTDRRISAGFNTGQLTGSATIYLQVAQGVWQVFRIVDTNPFAVCAC